MAKRKRPVNLHDALKGWVKSWRPDCTFSGSTPEEFTAWQRAFRRHYRRMIGPWPEKVPLDLEVVDRVERDDHIREKVLFDSSPGVTVPAYVLTPIDARPGDKRPGILAAHGHGNGKDDVCGVTRENGDPAGIDTVDRLNYEYGLEAVRRGYVVIAPDWCPFGERRPPADWCRPGRDPCNITDLAWQYFGRPLLTQSIWDGRRCVDVLESRPEVDSKRIAVLGLSQGGTMSTHMLVNEPRIKTGIVSGYISTVRYHALGEHGKGNTCGAQHVPGLLVHGDIPDMLGLAIPKPVLFEMGKQENCFHYPDMRKAYAYLRRMYKAAGVPDRIASDDHDGPHRWSGRKAWPWLQRWL